jgi:hypothetical protein
VAVTATEWLNPAAIAVTRLEFVSRRGMDMSAGERALEIDEGRSFADAATATDEKDVGNVDGAGDVIGTGDWFFPADGDGDGAFR